MFSGLTYTPESGVPPQVRWGFSGLVIVETPTRAIDRVTAADTTVECRLDRLRVESPKFQGDRTGVRAWALAGVNVLTLRTFDFDATVSAGIQVFRVDVKHARLP
jgi:hypothetical protein